MARIVMIMRHAEADKARAGRGDRSRELTPYGVRQAELVGRRIGAGDLPIPQTALISSATRTRETWAAIANTAGLPLTCDARDEFYGCWSSTWADAVRELPDEISTVILVGHAPEIPGLALDLDNRTGSEPWGWPTATMGVALWDGPWSGFDTSAQLVKILDAQPAR